MPDPSEPPERPPAPSREAVQRWRLILARGRLETDAGQREQLAAWERSLAVSGLPVAGLDARPPKPRLTLAAPLAASMSGEGELADLWLTRRMPAWEVRSSLAAALPAGYRLLDAYDVWLGEPALPGRVIASVYRATLATGAAGSDHLRSAAVELLAADALPRLREKGSGTVSYDLRPFLEGLEVSASLADDGGATTVLRLTLRHDPEKGVGRPDEVLAAIAERVGVPLEARTVVRETLVLAERVAPPPVQRAPGRGHAAATASSRRPRK